MLLNFYGESWKNLDGVEFGWVDDCNWLVDGMLVYEVLFGDVKLFG